jgi:hypothetical protein
MSAWSIRNAIEGRPLTISNVANVRLPARKFGCPYEALSLVSGNRRHNARKLGNTESVDVMVNL